MKRPAWIEIIPEEDAEGLLAELYERWMDRRENVVDNILRIHSLHPESLATHGDLYQDAMRGPSDLSFAEREMIAVVVSTANQCHY